MWINYKPVVKGMAFGVLIILAAVLQFSLFPRLPAPNPMTTVVATVSLSVFSGVSGGAVCGLLCGMLCDAMTPAVEAYFSLVMMAAGALTGFLCRRYLQKSLWTAWLLSTCYMLVIGFFYFLCFIFFTGRAGWEALYQVTLFETLSSQPWILFFYPVSKLVSKRFAEL